MTELFGTKKNPQNHRVVVFCFQKQKQQMYNFTAAMVPNDNSQQICLANSTQKCRPVRKLQRDNGKDYIHHFEDVSPIKKMVPFQPN